MAGVGAKKGILARLFGCDEAEGFNGVFFQELGGVEDTFVFGDETKFGSFRIGSHAVGGFTDFLNRGALTEDEEVVLGDIGVREMEADGFAGLHGEFFLGEEQSLGDAGNFDGLQALLSVE